MKFWYQMQTLIFSEAHGVSIASGCPVENLRNTREGTAFMEIYRKVNMTPTHQSYHGVPFILYWCLQ